jgi:hypothetical protein
LSQTIFGVHPRSNIMPTLSFLSAATLALVGAAALTVGTRNVATHHPQHAAVDRHPQVSVAQPSAAVLPPQALGAGDRQQRLDDRRAGLSFKDAAGLHDAVHAAGVDAASGDASALDLLVLVAATQCSSPFVADHWLCEAGK